jgi:hypothetical protein
MLHSLNELSGYVLEAKDGEIGRCKDFLFDDRFWTLRHMVADTGKWLPRRKILISPLALEKPDWGSRRFPVSMTKEDIENSPEIGADEPVSRQHETGLFQYYGWPYYWVGDQVWGRVDFPEQPYGAVTQEQGSPENGAGDDHLRSVNEVTGYHIQATDDEIGHVEEFIVDDTNWTIRYLVVDTRNWLPGRKVLISPTWAESIVWTQNIVKVNLTREQVKNSPKYDPTTLLDREFEARLFDYYQRPGYWI